MIFKLMMMCQAQIQLFIHYELMGIHHLPRQQPCRSVDNGIEQPRQAGRMSELYSALLKENIGVSFSVN
jgi:hypothetical protein